MLNSRCKHYKLVYESRSRNGFIEFRASCCCGKVFTNWHTTKERAQVAYWENQRDMKKRGLI